MVYDKNRCHYNVAKYLKQHPEDTCVVAYSNVAKLENGKSTWLFRDDDLRVSREVLMLWYARTGIPGHVHLRRGDLIGDILSDTMVFKTKREWILENGLLFQDCKNTVACAYVREVVKQLLLKT